MKKIIMSVLLAVFYAQVSAAVTEQQVIDATQLNNPAVTAAQKEYESADAYSHKDWFLPNPMVSIEFMDVADTMLNFTESMEKELAVTQSIPFPVKFIFKAGAGSENAAMALFRREMIKRNTAVEAYKAYAKLYRQQAELALANENAESLKQLALSASARYGNPGMDTSMNSGKADIEYALALNEVENLKLSLAAAADEVYAVTGKTIKPDADAVPEPEITEITKSADEFAESAMKNSPEIKMAEAEKNMAGNMRSLAFADYLPDLNVTYKRSLAEGSSSYSIMLMAELPIWFLNNQQAMIGKEGASYDAKERSLDDMKLRVETSVRQMHAASVNEYRSYMLYKTILVPKAMLLFKTAAAQMQSGKGNFASVLEAQKMLIMVQKDALMHMENYVMNYRSLLAMAAE